jgi:hypothetical protein
MSGTLQRLFAIESFSKFLPFLLYLLEMITPAKSLTDLSAGSAAGG